MDAGVAAALVISITTAIGTLINALHVQNCQSGCCSSDCTAPKEEKELRRPPTRQDLALMLEEMKKHISTQPGSRSSLDGLDNNKNTTNI
jgi:hypothetical protein